MVSAASLTFVDNPSHHRISLAGKLRGVALAVDLALHVKIEWTSACHRRENGELQTDVICKVCFLGLQ